MAEHPEEREPTQRQATGSEAGSGQVQEQQQQRGARGYDEDPADMTDPREEEGWTQPESSAQKGAEPDQG